MCAMLGAITAQAQMFIPVPVPGTAGAPTPPPPPTPPGTPSLWFDGSDIDGDGTYNSAYTDGDPVTTWVDKGSLGVDATQASAAAKPTYKTGGARRGF